MINITVNGDINESVLQELVKDKITEITMKIQGRAKELCPVNTGELRRQIMAETTVEGNKIIGTVGTNVEYAPYVHEGTGIYARNGNGRQTPWTYFDERTEEFVSTVGIEPTPFLENAVNEVIQEL